MARMRFSAPFLDELADLSERVENEVWLKLELVRDYPGVGSSLVEPSLRRAFGDACLKVTACGYDVLYERRTAEEGEELVDVLGIVAQRRVR